MSEWAKVRLKDIAEIKIGGTPSRTISAYWASEGQDGHQWCAISDLKGRYISETKERITDSGVINSNVKLLNAGSFVMSFKLSIGRGAILKSPMYTNEAIAGFESKGAINSDFLYYVLPQAALRSVTDVAVKGATLNKESLGNIVLSIPASESQQGCIANILQTIDEAIEKTEQLIEKYQQIKAGLMNDLFTRGIGADGKLRPPRAQAPELYHKTPIGWIPRDWDCELLDKVAVRGSGHTPSKSFPEYWDGGVKWISLADSHRLDKLYISETQFEISELGLQNSSAILHPPGIVVLSRDAGVGKSAITKAPMAVSQHFMCWRCDEKRMHNVFLYYWLQHNKRYFENIAMGSTILTIGLSYFKKLKIGVPSEFDEQKTIASSLLALEGKIFSMQSDLAKKKEVKSGLMHDLLTGKVSVSADLPVEPASPEEGAA
ncbi:MULTISPECIES: restriction endonuclease subunit S [Thalassolituus]|uniref:restriction endonuclease subunit S n=1 Tax=Thalassolituus TaxID=187492 RepID=UPI000C691533|nr:MULTISPECIES: restriction endonuclease subunit S [Thalassolituus]MAX87535.1 hypothetical protein [Oceanospirillaceae bacterium]|tara:strand:+ start:756 stop:2054 length:1299 start_codon:yes stop_codon:yes gene_type:complete